MTIYCLCCEKNFEIPYPQGFIKGSEGICEECEKNAPKEKLVESLLELSTGGFDF